MRKAELEEISAKVLMGGSERLFSVILTLAEVYNDLKGLIYLGLKVEEEFGEIDKFKPSNEAGENGGIRIQQYKLIVSHVSEFLRFIEENKDTFLLPEFLLLYSRLDKENQLRWSSIKRVSLNQVSKSKNTFEKSLIRIRNNIGFHYYQSGKILLESYKSFFFERERDELNKRAYYSTGNSMRSTRFYFADAAVQEGIELTAKDMIPALSFDEHFKQTSSLIDDMNQCLAAIIRSYIDIAKANAQ